MRYEELPYRRSANLNSLHSDSVKMSLIRMTGGMSHLQAVILKHQLGRAVLVTTTCDNSKRWNLFNRNYGVGSHMSDDNPGVIEKEAWKNLHGKTRSWIKEARGWNERLASDSEAVVMAERYAPASMEEMQKDTFYVISEEDSDTEGVGDHHI